MAKGIYIVESKKIDTKTSINFNGVTLYRIIYRFKNVNKEVIGGWVENEDCSINNGVILEEAKVYGKSFVEGNAIVKGHALVYDESKVGGNAIVDLNANIMKSYIYGHAIVSDNACIFNNSSVNDYARVAGNAYVSGNSYILGSTRLTDDVLVDEHSQLKGNIAITGDSEISSCNINGRAEIVSTKIYAININSDITIDKYNGYFKFEEFGKYEDKRYIIYTESNNRFFLRGMTYTKKELRKYYRKRYGFKGLIYCWNIMISLNLLMKK